MSALIDSAATDCFIKEEYVTSDIPREKANIIVSTASKNHSLKVQQTCELPLTINGATQNLKFLISDSLTSDLTLGKTWLKAQKVVHDHELDCLYLGVNSRQRVYLTRADRSFSYRAEVPCEFQEEINHNFPQEYFSKLKSLLGQYSDIFLAKGPLRQTRFTEFDIDLHSDKPFRITPHRYSSEKKRAIQEQVREMLANGLIEPSTSPYSSPVVLVRKKDGRFRFCTDYRRLNSLTKSRAQNLPIIQEIVKDFGNAKVFSTLDLKSGYWQIPLAPRARPLTAFSTPDGGLYQWRVMSFGLKNATGCFNDFISQEVLSGYMNEFVRSYLDDFMVYSNSLDEHLMHLGLIFERLRIYELTGSLEKCHFGHQSLEFLGYRITSAGNEAKVEHVRAILDAPMPRNRKDLRKFLGICGWLREFVPDFAQMALPLTALLAARSAWRWAEREQLAFDAIKRAFQAPLKLHRPEPGKPYILQTDASAEGMGAVLFQLGDRGERRIIAYASAKFTKAEKRYHSNEQECLAVFWAFRRFSRYLEDGQFTLRTDNRALTWLDRIKNEKSKLHRWSMYLRGFDFKIEHVPGKINELPDALSRQPDDNNFEECTRNIESLLPPEHRAHAEQAQFASAIAYELRDRVIEAQTRENRDELDRCLQPGQTMRVEDGALYLDEVGCSLRLYVPFDLRDSVIEYFHSDPLAGHPGALETLRAIREQYFWPKMREDVRRIIGKCPDCCLTKAARPLARGTMRSRKPFAPWDTVAVDMMGPYPRTSRGKRFILVATDLFSRWTEAFPTSNSETETIARVLEDELFTRWGYPRAILTDNAPQFRGRAWQKYCRSWGAESHTTAAYLPRANPTERRNQEIKKGLRLRLRNRSQREWDTHLPSILFTLRRRVNVNTGQSPSYTLLGRTLPRPGEWFHAYERSAQERICTAKQRANAPDNSEEIHMQQPLQIGDMVYAKNFAQSKASEGFNAGLAPRWTGPYPILERCSDDIYVLSRPGQDSIKLHVNTLKRASATPPTVQIPSVNQIEPSTPQHARHQLEPAAAPPPPERAGRLPPLSPEPRDSQTPHDYDPLRNEELASRTVRGHLAPYPPPQEKSQPHPEISPPQPRRATSLLPPRRRGRPTTAEAAARRAANRIERVEQTRYNLRSKGRRTDSD